MNQTATQKRSTGNGISPSPGFGVNVAGYLRGEFGLGEAARTLVNALDQAQISYVLNNVDVSWHRNLDNTLYDFSEDNPYPINLIGINVDQVPEFYALKGEKYFKERYK